MSQSLCAACITAASKRCYYDSNHQSQPLDGCACFTRSTGCGQTTAGLEYASTFDQQPAATIFIVLSVARVLLSASPLVLDAHVQGPECQPGSNVVNKLLPVLPRTSSQTWPHRRQQHNSTTQQVPLHSQHQLRQLNCHPARVPQVPQLLLQQPLCSACKPLQLRHKISDLEPRLLCPALKVLVQQGLGSCVPRIHRLGTCIGTLAPCIWLHLCCCC